MFVTVNDLNFIDRHISCLYFIAEEQHIIVCLQCNFTSRIFCLCIVSTLNGAAPQISRKLNPHRL